MKTLRIPCWLYSIFWVSLFISSCGHDSDELLGIYHITSIVKLSTCPEDFFSACPDISLPSGSRVGHIQIQQWGLRRIGITGSGTERIALNIMSGTHETQERLSLTGQLQDGQVRIHITRDIERKSCQYSRVIFVYGILEHDRFVGEIRSILTPSLPASKTSSRAACSCEVLEEFNGWQPIRARAGNSTYNTAIEGTGTAP